MVPVADLDRLSDAELKSLVIRQFELIAELQRTVATLRDEIVRHKGGPARPTLGIFISKRQVVRMLIAGQQPFLNQANDVRRAALSSSG